MKVALHASLLPRDVVAVGDVSRATGVRALLAWGQVATRVPASEARVHGGARSVGGGVAARLPAGAVAVEFRGVGLGLLAALLQADERLGAPSLEAGVLVGVDEQREAPVRLNAQVRGSASAVGGTRPFARKRSLLRGAR